MNYRYVVVEGSIGSGKEHLCRKLATYFGAQLILESPKKNPFLIPFYLNPQQHALAMQLYFLMDRAKNMNLIQEEENNSLNQLIISDFLLEKDQIFSPITLENDELTLYWQLRKKILPQFIRPDLIIYLQCSDEKAKNCLEAQDEGILNIIPDGYLEKIHNEYRRFFHLYDQVPILIVNMDELDLDNEEHFELLLHSICHFKGNRCYLNFSE